MGDYLIIAGGVILAGALLVWRLAAAKKKEGRLETEAKAKKAADKSREDQDEKDLEFERLRGDDAVSERVRAVLEASRDSDG